MKLPTKQQLEAAYKKAVNIHSQYLERYNIKLPKWEKNKKISNKAIWLSMLIYFEKQEVSKDLIGEAVRLFNPEASGDQQVRHLKRDGWCLVSENVKKSYYKLDPYKPSQEFFNEQSRKEALSLKDFKRIKSAFGNSCATCGAHEGQPDTRYGSQNIKLQKGHRDPTKPGDEENIIPQCQFCNRSYKRDFVFDSKGRVRSVASIEPIKRASSGIQKKIYSWLKKNL